MTQCLLSPHDASEIIAGLRRVEGQVQGLQRMIDHRRDCVDVIQQLSAARSALDRIGNQIVASDLRGCFSTAQLDAETTDRVAVGLKALATLRG